MSDRGPLARELWLRVETLHAVTYFGDETQDAVKALGLDGFWVGYFAFRAAPLGPVGPGVVDATFANFAPSFVRRWVPACWDAVDPAAAIAVRAAAAAATLRRVAPDIDQVVEQVADPLGVAIAAGDATGRPLFAANRDVPLPDDPVAALWQRCTTLREHRGDSHVAALAAHGLTGLQAHVLIAAEQATDPADLQRTRGWTAEEWDGARRDLGGLVTPEGQLTPEGEAVRRDVEAITDARAADPLRRWTDAMAERALESLRPAAAAVSASGVLRYPNPIGLPPIA